jgi:hypothetical protein
MSSEDKYETLEKIGEFVQTREVVAIAIVQFVRLVPSIES